MRQIILDTETTGLEPSDGHRIIEIGCIELINRKFTGKNFHVYINPEREVDKGALKVHGITNSFLKNKKIFGEIYSEFKEFIMGAELIIHNAAFDMGFLNHEVNLLNRTYPKVETFCKVLDTLTMARKLHPGQRNSLDALCKRYHVDNTNRKLHGALLDAEILAKVYLAMTGGQKNLFDQPSVNHPTSEAKADKIIAVEAQQKQMWELPVVSASEAEVKAHQDYFEES